MTKIAFDKGFKLIWNSLPTSLKTHYITHYIKGRFHIRKTQINLCYQESQVGSNIQKKRKMSVYKKQHTKKNFPESFLTFPKRKIEKFSIIIKFFDENEKIRRKKNPSSKILEIKK